MTATCLALDLGAESGRAVLGRHDGGVITIREIARFPNEPIRQDGSLRWDADRLWAEVRLALGSAAGAHLASVGVDSWGCDYALIDAAGHLAERPYHYRDRRTDGVMDEVFRQVPPARLYEVTGIQFLPFNTLFQLYAAGRSTPEVLARAQTLLTIPDWINFQLTGCRVSEYTNATTTQCVDAASRTWAAPLLEALRLPTRLFAPLVEPGTAVGAVRPSACEALAGCQVVAPACHDTGSAVASISAAGSTAFVSSGTWSLVGTEVPEPILTPRARELNFTNEGGVDRSTRLLRNIAGLWLLQACRRDWMAGGSAPTYDQLLDQAAVAEPFRALLDPDHASFLHPEHMTDAIAGYCRASRQPVPETPGAYARTILESLAFKYRVVVEWLETLTGTRVTTLHVVGGGARNRLLNQFTADATGRMVLAGPIEATAIGNIGVQLVATGAVGSLGEARALIAESFPPARFEPRAAADWDRQFPRFRALDPV